MGCGSFCYSIAWTDNFPLIIVLRFVSDIMMGAFEVLADLILPENWTSNDAQTVKMTLAVSVPAFLIAYCLVHATPHPKTGRRMFTYAGSFIIYTLLPMITIPVVGTLFRPIVGCHFDAPWMDPVPLRPEDESTRAAPIEMQFQPVHLRHDCAFGDKTETYFDLGLGLMIPFWAIGLFLGSQGSTERMLFPVHKGFHVLHTQLMVVVAMACKCTFRQFETLRGPERERKVGLRRSCFQDAAPDELEPQPRGDQRSGDRLDPGLQTQRPQAHQHAAAVHGVDINDLGRVRSARAADQRQGLRSERDRFDAGLPGLGWRCHRAKAPRLGLTRRIGRD